MTDKLHFLKPNSDGEDQQIAELLKASYREFPNASSEQLQRCQNAIQAAIAKPAPTGGISQRFSLGVASHRWWYTGAAAAALLAAVTFRPSNIAESGKRATDSIAAAITVPTGKTTVIDGGHAIRFEIRLPAAAHDVALVGDFNGWDSDATPMIQRSNDGSWIASVPLVPGVHKYAFVVDGSRWMIDPLAPQLPDAGFGPANAVVVGSL